MEIVTVRPTVLQYKGRKATPDPASRREARARATFSVCLLVRILAELGRGATALRVYAAPLVLLGRLVRDLPTAGDFVGLHRLIPIPMPTIANPPERNDKARLRRRQ